MRPDGQGLRAIATTLDLGPSTIGRHVGSSWTTDRPGATQTYRRRVAPHRPDVATIDCITAGGRTSALSARMRKTPNAYGSGAMAGTALAGHPYAVDPIYDSVGAGFGDLLPAGAIERLASQAPDLAAEVLPDGDTWELDARSIRRWLTERGVIRTLEA